MAAVCVGVGCLSLGCQPADTQDAKQFEVGSADDPVVQMALSSAATTTTLTITIKNNSNSDVTAGLLTLAPIFTVGQPLSTAVNNFVSDKSSTAAQNSALVTALGLTLNVNAFKVGDLGKGKSRTLTVTVPTGSSLYYIGRVDSTSTDFVGINNVELGGALTGYTVRNGVVVRGNGSTGTTAGTSAAVDQAVCSGAAAMTTTTQLFDDEMALAAGDRNWPVTAGYDGEFNGDWYTDGISARVWNQGGLPRGAVTGFVKFISICPTSGARISLDAVVDTAQYSAASSDTTLHIYYFDAANALIKVDYNFALHKGTNGDIGLYDSAVPSNARRIALVPMARFDAAEASSVFYHSLHADYEPANAVTKTTIATDSFAAFDATTHQPTGWVDFNGDWYAMPTEAYVTYWNPAWGGDQTVLPPLDTGMTKTFSLGATKAGDSLDASLFAAVTFTDPTSFAMLRLVFDTGQIVESTRLGGQSYNQLNVRRTPVPAGAKSVTVNPLVHIGPAETSSLYLDDLSVQLVR